MRKINKPEYPPEEVFRTCISQVSDPDLKHRLELCESDIILASQEFEIKASNSSVHTISVSDNVSGYVSGTEMVKVYTDRMAKRNSPGRKYYDRLISTPKHGRCPLCGQRVVSTLDHYLPKAYFPVLSIVPFNLVPCCKDCNKIKTDRVPNDSKEITLHPYFDDIDDDVWLKSCVIESKPVSVRFYVDPPSFWLEILSERVKNHFKVFELASLYGSHAADELLSIRHLLKMIFSKGGRNAVSAVLQDQADSRSTACKNSWQTALYSELAGNKWFCSGGFE